MQPYLPLKTPRSPYLYAPCQAGLSLLELLLGLSIGLLTITTAIGTLWLVHSMSNTVSEQAQLQQQASYALRVLGQQIRQTSEHAVELHADPLATLHLIHLNGAAALHGDSQPNAYRLTVRTPNPLESAYKNDTSFEPKSLGRNCLQENSTEVLSSRFKLQAGQLMCAGTGTPQAIITDVTEFQVRYLLVRKHGNTAEFEYVSTPAENQWQQVQAVEVCLALTGQININNAGSSYVRCDGSSADRGNRQHVVVRNHYSIRSRL